MAMSQEYMLRR